MKFDLPQIWTAAGVLLGFQVSAFSWRIQQEAHVADRGDISWIPPADYMNLTAMVVTVLGVFVLPVVGLVSDKFAQMMFGLGAILFVGHSFALAAHYELFNRNTTRSYQYCPPQEKRAIVVVVAISLAYLGWYAAKNT